MKALLALLGVMALTFIARALHMGAFVRPGDEAILVLGFVLLGSFLTGELASRVGLPLITGYLIAGVVFGPVSALVLEGNLVAVPENAIKGLKVIEHVALGLIAFTAGGELKFRELRDRGPGLLLVATLQTAGSFVMVASAAFLLAPLFSFAAGGPLSLVWAGALLLGALMIPNSPATVVAVMNECQARGTLTDTVLAVTVIKDILAVLTFVVTLSVVEVLVGGARGVDLGAVGRMTWEIGGSLLIGGALGWLLGIYIERVGAELPLVVVGLGFTSMYLSGGVELSGLLICMAAGFTVENLSRKGDALIRAVEAYSLPVYVVFFTITGAGIDLAALARVWPLALLMVGLRAVAIYASTRLGCYQAGDEVVVQRFAWLGFIGQAGVTLGLIALIAEVVPELGRSLSAVVIATIAINQVIGPVGFRWAILRAGEAYSRSSRG